MSLDLIVIVFTIIGSIATLFGAYVAYRKKDSSFNNSGTFVGRDYHVDNRSTDKSVNVTLEVPSKTPKFYLRIFAFFLGTFLIYYLASPYLYLYKFHNAIESGNSRVINESVHWEPLRIGLKEDVSSVIQAASAKGISSAKEQDQKFLVIAASGFIGMTVNAVIDNLNATNISMLIKLIKKNSEGEDFFGQIESEPAFMKASMSRDKFESIRKKVHFAFFTSVNEFMLSIGPNEKEIVADLKFVYMDYGWKLNRIYMSDTVINQIIDEFK